MEQSVYGGCANKMQFNLVGSDNVTIARQALAAYDLPGYELVFLRHSDNVTFRAEKPGSEPYLLRIHIPITTAMGTHGTDPAMIPVPYHNTVVEIRPVTSESLEAIFMPNDPLRQVNLQQIFPTYLGYPGRRQTVA